MPLAVVDVPPIILFPVIVPLAVTVVAWSTPLAVSPPDVSRVLGDTPDRLSEMSPPKSTKPPTTTFVADSRTPPEIVPPGAVTDGAVIEAVTSIVAVFIESA